MAVQQREYERGTVLWSAVEKIAGQGKTLEYNHSFEVLKKNLLEDAFAKAWQRGQTIKFKTQSRLR